MQYSSYFVLMRINNQNFFYFTIHTVLLLQMSQATQNVVEDDGSVSVCAEINDTTLPFQRNTTVQIFTIALSAGD